MCTAKAGIIPSWALTVMSQYGRALSAGATERRDCSISSRNARWKVMKGMPLWPCTRQERALGADGVRAPAALLVLAQSGCKSGLYGAGLQCGLFAGARTRALTCRAAQRSQAANAALRYAHCPADTGRCPCLAWSPRGSDTATACFTMHSW